MSQTSLCHPLGDDREQVTSVLFPVSSPSVSCSFTKQTKPTHTLQLSWLSSSSLLPLAQTSLWEMKREVVCEDFTVRKLSWWRLKGSPSTAPCKSHTLQAPGGVCKLSKMHTISSLGAHLDRGCTSKKSRLT